MNLTKLGNFKMYMFVSGRIGACLVNYLSIALQGVFISKIAEGGTAERDGRLQVGDKVLSVSIAVATQFIS